MSRRDIQGQATGSGDRIVRLREISGREGILCGLGSMNKREEASEQDAPGLLNKSWHRPTVPQTPLQYHRR